MVGRLPPERQLRLYIAIARRVLPLGAIGVALACVHNVRDAIAQLQEDYTRRG